MHLYIWVLSSLSLSLRAQNVRGFNTKARFAEWGVENSTDDDIGNFLKSMSEDKGIPMRNHTAEIHERMKRLATFDSADRRHGTTKLLILHN